MKWSSLTSPQQRELCQEYDRRHADDVPVEPEFPEFENLVPQVISTSARTDLYVRMSGADNRHSPKTAHGALRLVSSNEHVEVDLPITSIDPLIEQLQLLKLRMVTHDNLMKEYQDSMNAYRESKESYEALRDKQLSEALENGKFTEDVIAHQVDDIPF